MLPNFILQSFMYLHYFVNSSLVLTSNAGGAFWRTPFPSVWCPVPPFNSRRVMISVMLLIEPASDLLIILTISEQEELIYPLPIVWALSKLACALIEPKNALMEDIVIV